MTTAEKIERAKADLDNAYQAGKKAEYDAFWDGIQDFGKRTSLNYMFIWWKQNDINPKYPLPIVDSVQQMFYGCTNLIRHPTLKIKDGGAFFYQAFYMCYGLEEVALECVGSNSRANCFTQTFGMCRNCVKIAKVVPAENHTFVNTFTGCDSLVDITFDGVIGNDINFQDCPLSVESMISIITHLKPLDSENAYSRAVYFNQDCWARLEAAGIPTPWGYNTWKEQVEDGYYWNT